MYYFIVNSGSQSGAGLKSWRLIKNELDRRELEYKAFKTEVPGDATVLARKISKRKDDDIRLILIGGDGTLNDVINGIADFEKVSVGLIPLGSGNDFARGIGIKGTTEEILEDLLSKGREDYIATDLGHVEAECVETTDGFNVSESSQQNVTKTRLFAISSGFGLDALVCKKVDEGTMKKRLNHVHMGKFSYSLQTVKSLFTMDTFRAGGESDLESRLYNEVIFTAVMNLPYEGGGVPMSPDASPFDGHLSVCTAAGIKKWKTFLKFPKLLAAKQAGIKGFHMFETYRLKMNFDRPVVVHTDGEYLGEAVSVSYECLTGKLKLLNTTAKQREEKFFEMR